MREPAGVTYCVLAASACIPLAASIAAHEGDDAKCLSLMEETSSVARKREELERY